MNDLVSSMDERLNEQLQYINDLNDLLSQKLKKHEIYMILRQSEVHQMKRQQEFQFSLLEDVLLDRHQKGGDYNRPVPGRPVSRSPDRHVKSTSVDSAVHRIRNKSTKG